MEKTVVLGCAALLFGMLVGCGSVGTGEADGESDPSAVKLLAPDCSCARPCTEQQLRCIRGLGGTGRMCTDGLHCVTSAVQCLEHSCEVDCSNWIMRCVTPPTDGIHRSIAD